MRLAVSACAPDLVRARWPREIPATNMRNSLARDAADPVPSAVERAKAGDEAAFRELYQKHARRVVGTRPTNRVRRESRGVIGARPGDACEARRYARGSSSPSEARR